MAKTPRPVRMASDPQEEKIVETIIDMENAPSARQQSLFSETRYSIVSAIPVAPPVGYVKQPSMVDHIRGLVRSEHLRWAAEGSGAESFEEADDFEVGDDLDPSSPYEEQFDPPVPPPTPPSDAPSLKAGGPPEAGGTQPATPLAEPSTPSPTPAKTA